MAYMRDGQTPPLKGKGSKIRGKMLLFIEKYMADPKMNGSQAVLDAGYHSKNPNRMAVQLLRHPLVKQEIESRLAARKERMELTSDYVLGKLMEIAQNTEEDNPQAALRALELLGKNLGLFRERQEISGPDGQAIEMNQRVKEDVSDFQSKLARLAASNGERTVVSFPQRGSTSSS